MKALSIIPVILFIYSCSNTVDCREVKYIDGVSYYKGKEYDGECESYFFNGNLKSKQFYTKGLDNKSWIFYYSNKNKKTEAFFKNGRRVGQWNFYAKNGSIWKINFYDSLGAPKGEWETYDTINGDLIELKKAKDIFN